MLQLCSRHGRKAGATTWGSDMLQCHRPLQVLRSQLSDPEPSLANLCNTQPEACYLQIAAARAVKDGRVLPIPSSAIPALIKLLQESTRLVVRDAAIEALHSASSEAWQAVDPAALHSLGAMAVLEKELRMWRSPDDTSSYKSLLLHLMHQTSCCCIGCSTFQEWAEEWITRLSQQLLDPSVPSAQVDACNILNILLDQRCAPQLLNLAVAALAAVVSSCHTCTEVLLAALDALTKPCGRLSDETSCALLPALASVLSSSHTPAVLEKAAAAAKFSCIIAADEVFASSLSDYSKCIPRLMQALRGDAPLSAQAAVVKLLTTFVRTNEHLALQVYAAGYLDALADFLQQQSSSAAAAHVVAEGLYQLVDGQYSLSTTAAAVIVPALLQYMKEWRRMTGPGGDSSMLDSCCYTISRVVANPRERDYVIACGGTQILAKLLFMNPHDATRNLPEDILRALVAGNIGRQVLLAHTLVDQLATSQSCVTKSKAVTLLLELARSGEELRLVVGVIPGILSLLVHQLHPEEEKQRRNYEVMDYLDIVLGLQLSHQAWLRRTQHDAACLLKLLGQKPGVLPGMIAAGGVQGAVQLLQQNSSAAPGQTAVAVVQLLQLLLGGGTASIELFADAGGVGLMMRLLQGTKAGRAGSESRSGTGPAAGTLEEGVVGDENVPAAGTLAGGKEADTEKKAGATAATTVPAAGRGEVGRPGEVNAGIGKGGGTAAGNGSASMEAAAATVAGGRREANSNRAGRESAVPTAAPAVVLEVVQLLVMVAADPAGQAVIVETDGIDCLVQLLQHDTPEVTFKAADVLKQLARGKDNAKAIADAGALYLLLEVRDKAAQVGLHKQVAGIAGGKVFAALQGDREGELGGKEHVNPARKGDVRVAAGTSAGAVATGTVRAVQDRVPQQPCLKQAGSVLRKRTHDDDMESPKGSSGRKQIRT